MIAVRFQPTFDHWLDRASEFLKARQAPADILWVDAKAEQSVLPGMDMDEAVTPALSLPVRRPEAPRQFVTLARRVAAHRDDAKWPLLYSILYRLTYDDPHLLRIEVDEEVARLLRMDRQVGRDAHKMKAFVRFRRAALEGSDCYIAWHQPDHDVLPLVAPFFVERFAAMTWSILTPDRSAHWDRATLRYGEGVSRSQAPRADELEDLWRTYYAAIFNPARVKVKAMRAEMPVRYWPTLPETRLIPSLLAAASSRASDMIASQQQEFSALPFVPIGASLADLRPAAAHCAGCPLHLHATQTIFGEGPPNARIVLVGEQPGDQEDRQGAPFVGPAGDVLNQALAEAGLKRHTIYLTNAVKHFKFVVEGKRRKHQTPRHSEVVACRPWLEAELMQVQPDIVVCLGATAAKSLVGAQFRLMQQRGEWLSSRRAFHMLATLHPSAILRAGDAPTRQRLYTMLVNDLRKVSARHVAQTEDSGPRPRSL